MKMKRYPVVLSIAGSDCSGGAGIQADIKTISALGVYAASVITAITIQNTLGVSSVHAIPADIVRAQIEAVMDDMHPDAVKIGMIHEPDTIKAIADCLRKYSCKQVVYDPVMVSTSGKRLLERGAIEDIKKELFPLVTLLTPNLDEVAALSGKTAITLQDMKWAAEELSKTYRTSVLLKGGHLPGNEMYDVLFMENKSYIYKEEKIDSRNLHGTGCTLSSAIASYLAQGYAMDAAVACSKKYVSEAIKAGKDVMIGQGNGPLCHFFNPIKTILTNK